MPAGQSLATLPKAPGPTPLRQTERSKRIIGTAPVRHQQAQLSQPIGGLRFGCAGRRRRLPGRRPSHSGALDGLCAAAHGVRRRSPGESDDLTAMINIVRSLLDEVDGTVGVICPPSSKDQLAAQLEHARLPGAERVVVITAQQAKGLEYDAVW